MAAQAAAQTQQPESIFFCQKSNASHLTHDHQTGSSHNKEGVPLGRIAQLVDVATVILFLASDASNYVTGQNIALDSGLVA